jgi:hypothetical protein
MARYDIEISVDLNDDIVVTATCGCNIDILIDIDKPIEIAAFDWPPAVDLLNAKLNAVENRVKTLEDTPGGDGLMELDGESHVKPKNNKKIKVEIIDGLTGGAILSPDFFSGEGSEEDPIVPVIDQSLDPDSPRPVANSAITDFLNTTQDWIEITTILSVYGQEISGANWNLAQGVRAKLSLTRATTLNPFFDGFEINFIPDLTRGYLLLNPNGYVLTLPANSVNIGDFSIPTTGTLLLKFLYVNNTFYWELSGNITKEQIAGLKTTDSPEFANSQITTLNSVADGGIIPNVQATWLGATSKSVLSYLQNLVGKLYALSLDLAANYQKKTDNWATVVDYTVPAGAGIAALDITHNDDATPFSHNDILIIVQWGFAWAPAGSILRFRFNGISSNNYRYANNLNTEYPVLASTGDGGGINRLEVNALHNTIMMSNQGTRNTTGSTWAANTTNPQAIINFGVSSAPITQVTIFVNPGGDNILAGTRIIIKALK